MSSANNIIALSAGAHASTEYGFQDYFTQDQYEEI
jgi:hypothetical protein